MDLLFYADAHNRIRKEALAHVEMAVPDAHIVACQTLEDLSRKILRSSRDFFAVVVFIEDTHELTSILLLQEELQRHRLILVLPDLLPETTTKGHVLRPRFLTSVDSEPQELTAVLGKMKQNAFGS